MKNVMNISKIVNKELTDNSVKITTKSGNQRNSRIYLDDNGNRVPELINGVKNPSAKTLAYGKGIKVTIVSNCFEIDDKTKQVTNVPKSLDSATLLAVKAQLDGSKCEIDETTYELSNSQFEDNLFEIEEDSDLMAVTKLYYPKRQYASVSIL
ncbi:MAG: hypothetical protein Unbinned5179contig1000_44 [Prokaryotic dsDNA virus sp.]|nr:MAG: hypothetical protein Unbinned5179contig1000_44 [Prokaryotic dsDNA virus sp.]|tara:strand:- start:227 stop:685 length:459 start_codon:yes stop_codon:yes gene_type:complete